MLGAAVLARIRGECVLGRRAGHVGWRVHCPSPVRREVDGGRWAHHLGTVVRGLATDLPWFGAVLPGKLQRQPLAPFFFHGRIAQVSPQLQAVNAPHGLDGQQPAPTEGLVRYHGQMGQ